MNIQSLIQSNIYQKDGHSMIKIPHYGLDFSGEFVFLGFTKTGNVKLGEIYKSGPDGIEYQKRIGKWNGKYLTVCGDNFLKSLDELEKDSKPKEIQN